MEKEIKDKKEIETEIKQIEAKLRNANEEDKVIALLATLEKRNFKREDIINSKIILTIKQIKEKYKDNKGIESKVISLITSWKKREQEKQKEEQYKSYDVSQLNEEAFTSSDINAICNELLKNEIDNTRKTTKRVLFTTIAESKEAFRIYQDTLIQSKVKLTKFAFLNKIKQAVIEIESGLNRAYLQFRNPIKYKGQTKTLISKLGSNAELIEKILTNTIKLSSMATMSSEELMSSEEKKKLDKLKEDCFEARRLDWNIIHGNVISTGIYKCGKCKSTNTTYCQIQIRRADEPMTTFVTCSECGNSWRC